MFARSVVLSAALVAASCSRPVPSLVGDWDATIVNLAKAEVPFRFRIGGTPERPTGTFVNGDERMPSTGGRFENGQLTLDFDQYGAKIIARLNGDTLAGEYNRGTRGASYPFRATRAVERPADSHPPSIAGDWKIPAPDDKYESSWRFIVRQSGADVSAAIQRVDGDTGTLTGSFRGGQLLLGHFSGARPMRLEVTINPDGTLGLLEDGQIRHTALRFDDPRAAGTGDPKDPTQLTRAKNPGTPLSIEFPDLAGTPVSLSDARFRGKVIILSVTGSWCPNCHDEAPVLTELYRTYHDRGLEIVLLAFEEAGQLANPMRLKAFVKQYGITYPVLLVGEPKDLAAKLPQFESLVAFPTSIYIGRDGRVRGTHAGFSSVATGTLHEQTREEITRTVETLVAENAPSDRGADLVTSAAGLANPTPISPRAPAQRVSVGASARRRSQTAYDLVLQVMPHPGMHLYAPGATGYTPVGLSLTPTTGVVASPTRYPKAEDYYFVPTKEHLPVYQQAFELVTPVTVPATLRTIAAMLTYQACDDRLCYPPQSMPVVFTLAADAP